MAVPNPEEVMSERAIKELAALIDHTNLRANATAADIERLCGEALEYGFGAVCVNQAQVRLASRLLAQSHVRVATTVAFPLGQTSITAKVFETRDALEAGADEIDYVVNLTQVRDGAWGYVEQEMAAIVRTCREFKAAAKVIFENCYLTRNEKIALIEIANSIRPDFIKTSTGFGSGGATFEDVKLMRGLAVPEVRVKAAGGIRDAESFLGFVRLGAERIGCSAGIAIMEELRGNR